MAAGARRLGMDGTMTTAAILGLCVLGCLGVVAAPLPSSDMINPESSRAKSMRRSEARLAATVFALAMLSVGILLALERGATWPITPLAIVTVAGLVALHPWLAVRWISIPLGLPRLAVTLGRLGGHPWMRDPEGGAVLSGVLAQLRRPRDAAMNDWLRARLRRGPLRGAGLVAAGLLAADANDRDRARALLASLDDLDPALCPPLARRIALDWRIADAARTGDWARVLTLTEEQLSPTRTVRLMAALARHHGGDTAQTGALWRAWLVAPHRRHTLALVRGAITAPEHLREITLGPIELANDTRLAANDGGPAPREALALHVEAMVDGDVPGAGARMARLGTAWDRVMDDFGFRGHVRRRAESLRCTVLGEKVLARMHREICEDMGLMLTQGDAPADAVGTGLTARRAVGHMHGMALEELERLCTAVDGPHPPCATVDQVLTLWLAWLEVRTRYRALARVTAPDVRKQAYAVVELHLRQLMAWLWNDLGERGLANALSTWLLLEAERVHDEDSAAYHRHNVALVI